MAIRSLSVAFLAVVLSSWLYAQNPSEGEAAESEIRKARYEVLTAIIPRYYKDSTAPIVIDEFLEPCLDSSYFQGDTDKIIDRLRLAKMNNDCLLIPKEKVDTRLFKSPHRFLVIEDGGFRKFFEPGPCRVGWEKFYKRFPGTQGYVRLSLVGFDEARQFAYVDFAYSKECLNSEVHIFLLRKTRIGWEIAADSLLLVS